MEYKITRKPMPLYSRFHNYNNNNLHEYDPYIIVNDDNNDDIELLLIDENWWNSLTIFTKDRIISRVGINNFKLVTSSNIPIPHEICDSHPYLTTVYRAYLMDLTIIRGILRIYQMDHEM